jgi:hypothetical protein
MRSICVLSALLGAWSFLLAPPLRAQDPSGDDRMSATVALNQDVFFGFYPTFSTSYKMNKTVDWTTYGILWTTPSFGTGGGGGLWTEFGTGVNLKAFDGQWTINPSLGFLNGKLLSNGNFPMAFEGIVPNIVSNVNTKRVEAELYAGFYTALRKGRVPNNAGGLTNAPVQNNFTHWWINGGVKLIPALSAGVHYEALDFRPSGAGASGVSSAGLYKWIGPYVQANITSKFSVRFSFGADVLDRPPTNGTDSFYKLTAKYSFP